MWISNFVYRRALRFLLLAILISGQTYAAKSSIAAYSRCVAAPCCA